MNKLKTVGFRLPYSTWQEFSKRLIDDDLSAQEFFARAVQNYLGGNDEMKKFFKTKTYAVDHGYTIHLSHAPEFATEAVVEDADGKRTLVDVSKIDYADFEEMLDAIIEEYEKK